MSPSPADTLEQARTFLEKRLKELDDERGKIEQALANLTGGRIGRRRPGRPRAAATRAAAAPRRRRRGTRSDQALRLVKRNPGITAGEVAKKMGIAPNYVYRVMSDLEKQGKVRKKGRAYTAA